MMMVWDVTSLGKGITLPLSAAFLLQVCLLSWFLNLDNGAFEVCRACTGLHLPVSLDPCCSCLAQYTDKEPRSQEGKDTI